MKAPAHAQQIKYKFNFTHGEPPLPWGGEALKLGVWLQGANIVHCHLIACLWKAATSMPERWPRPRPSLRHRVVSLRCFLHDLFLDAYTTAHSQKPALKLAAPCRCQAWKPGLPAVPAAYPCHHHSYHRLSTDFERMRRAERGPRPAPPIGKALSAPASSDISDLTRVT